MQPYLTTDLTTIYKGDCREVLAQLPSESVHTVVTSPPYFGLRDYGVQGQLGLEATPEAYVANMVAVFGEVRRVLREDGTVWLNLGDSYWRDPKRGNQENGGHAGLHTGRGAAAGMQHKRCDLPEKNLLGIPWRVAFALQADGWYLRSDIIWHKPNPMPESVTDRPTKAHEYIFLLSRSPRYYYDYEAIKEPAADASLVRWAQDLENQNGSTRANGGMKANGPMKAVGGPRSDKQRGHSRRHAGFNERWDLMTKTEQAENGRNKRTVWTVATQPYPQSHFATYPEKLIEPCILAGTSEQGCCPECGAPWERIVERTNESNWEMRKELGAVGGSMHGGNKQQIGAGWSHDLPSREVQTVGWRANCNHGHDPVPCVVLDPFSGSGTTGKVAVKHRRQYIGIELNPQYIDMARMDNTQMVMV
jgi:DNA modification methylase